MTSLPIPNILQPQNTQPMVATLQFTTKVNQGYTIYDAGQHYPAGLGPPLLKSILNDDIEQKVLLSLYSSSPDSLSSTSNVKAAAYKNEAHE